MVIESHSSEYTFNNQLLCCTPFYKKCLQYHRYNEENRITLETFDTISEELQISLVEMRAASVGDAFYLQRLRVIKVKSRTLRSLYCPIL